MKSMTEFRTLSSPRSVSAKNSFATFFNASFGHAWNQLIVVQLIKAGNLLALVLKTSPTGEKHRVTCKLFFTLLIKYDQQSSGVSPYPSAFTFGLTALMIFILSSSVYKSATSPELNKSFI